MREVILKWLALFKISKHEICQDGRERESIDTIAYFIVKFNNLKMTSKQIPAIKLDMQKECLYFY